MVFVLALKRLLVVLLTKRIPEVHAVPPLLNFVGWLHFAYDLIPAQTTSACVNVLE